MIWTASCARRYLTPLGLPARRGHRARPIRPHGPGPGREGVEEGTAAGWIRNRSAGMIINLNQDPISSLLIYLLIFYQDWVMKMRWRWMINRGSRYAPPEKPAPVRWAFEMQFESQGEIYSNRNLRESAWKSAHSKDRWLSLSQLRFQPAWQWRWKSRRFPSFSNDCDLPSLSIYRVYLSNTKMRFHLILPILILGLKLQPSISFLSMDYLKRRRFYSLRFRYVDDLWIASSLLWPRS